VTFGYSPAALAGVLLAAPLAAQAPASDAGFVLTSHDPARAPSPFIGNGRVGVVIPATGLGASHSFVAGLYEQGPEDVPRIAAAPAWNAVSLGDGEGWLGPAPPADGAIRAYRQVLDMRAGTIRTTYDWVHGGRRIGVAVQMLVSRAAPKLAALRLELTPREAGPVHVRFALAGWPRPRRLALAQIERADPVWKPADIWYPGNMAVRTRDARAAGSRATLTLTATPVGRTTELAEAASVSWPDDLAGASVRPVAEGDSAVVEIAFAASPGRSYTFTQLTALVPSTETTNPLAVASRRLEEGRVRGYDGLAADNAAAWARRWKTDIVIEGDTALQRVVRSMLFYLLCSADSGTALGIPPMGLSGAGYYGHVFWDSDTWMFPSLLLTHPDVARSLTDFRARTLGAAQANARANGYRGAMYPWEADELGHETTPRFAIQNARSEIHVNGDVALAQWQDFLASGDSGRLARVGFPVIRGTADFWVSRATFDSAVNRYHIRNVVSVAEGLIGVSDDAYTNAVARLNLHIAAAAARRLGLRADPRWTEVADRLHLPVDSATGFFRTYAGAPDSTLGVITPLLTYPLGVPMSARAKRAHLDQAVGRLTDEASGAMMGITLLSVVAAELGDRALVDSLLPYSYRGHLRGPFLMLSETPTNDAVNFVTGAGGFLQQVLFGYTGLRLGEGGLEQEFPAVLPSSVRRLILRNVSVRGRRYDVVVDSTGRRVLPHHEAVPR